ncbi:MAG: hypothetical protein Q9164_000317 [Protoblastenia rupestris]
MSAPNWLNDPQPYQNGENGAFNGASDPSMAFMHTPTSSTFDFHHIQTQQLQQRMQNGNIANGSLVPHNPNPMYQTQTTIPSKRPRPREDSVGGSPRPYSGTLPVSRSQTPHGTYPGYSVAVNGATFPANNSYAGMQQPVTTASHSPGMPNQNHNPQNPQQRLQTMSPSPFSPAAQTFGNHVSPPHSENGTRVNTPQNSGQQYSNNAPYGMGTGQPFMPPAATSVNGVQPSHFSQNSQHEQMMMDARMRQTAQMGPLRGGGHQQGLSFNSSGQPLNQLSSVQITQMRAQQTQPNQQRPQYMQNMLHNITQFARQRGIHFDPQPLIAFRPVSSIQLFFGVLKLGGSRRISLGQQWPQVATLLGYPPPQSMVAGQELQSYWHSSLADFETYYMQHQQSQQQQRQRALADPMRSAVSFQPSDTAPRQPSFSPAKQMHDPQQARFMQQPSNPNVPYQTPTQHITPTQPGIRHPLPNGYIDPQKARMQASPPNVYNQQPTMAPNQLRNEILQGHQAPVSIVRGRREKSKQENPDNSEFWRSRKAALSPMYIPRANNLELKPQRPAGKDDEDADGHAQMQDSAIDETSGSTFPTNHGGFPVTEPGHREGIEALLKFKLRAPLLEELGPIDIRAITLSLRSTINGEVRHALDTIASLSITKSPPSLDQCEDLVEALVDCADDQVEVLAEHAPEVSDAMLITSYEDTVRGCKAEISEMQIYPDFGTLEHHLDKAIDRLICITTILRNFAFSEASHRALTDPIVLKMMTTVIRYLGTRNMMLRTHRNALDFTKDVVVFLSQTAHRLDFQNKDEALCILHFLVSFAPLPEPNDGRDSEVTFSSYSPSLNRYLPHAVDSLAKLLTREPNRSFCRTIFMSDAASTLPYDLLTRAFGLAVGPVPEIGITEPTNTVTYRIPFLVQGLLAAEILIGMIPSSGRHLASSWANSYDGFASRLMRMVAILSRKLPAQPDPQQQRHNGPHGAPPKEAIDHYGYIMVTNRGLAVLRKLIEKAKEADGDIKRLPSGILPNQQNVVAALSAPTMDGDVIRQLCAFSGLDT